MPTVKDAGGNPLVIVDSVDSLTYSASITPDSATASIFQVVATNGTGFTINAPVSPVLGRVITFDIKNSSGGALGTITWDAVYKKGAFTSPGNGLRSTIQFYYDGTNWVALNAQSLAS